MFTQVMLPAGATHERTVEVLEKVEHHFLRARRTTSTSIFTIAGFSFGGRARTWGWASSA